MLRDFTVTTLTGNIFGLILKNKMAAMDIFSTFSKEFCWPSRTKGIIGSDLTFDHGALLQGQTRIAKLKSAYNSLIIGCTGLGW